MTHGITFISRLQLWTQPVWFVLNLVPILAVLITHPEWLHGWVGFGGHGHRISGFDLAGFGAAASILFAMITQTAEQVDFIRFLPPRETIGARRWWTALLLGGPGWIVIDVVKLLAGSLLAYVALHSGLVPDQAVQPAQMYRLAFATFTSSGRGYRGSPARWSSSRRSRSTSPTPMPGRWRGRTSSRASPIAIRGASCGSSSTSSSRCC